MEIRNAVREDMETIIQFNMNLAKETEDLDLDYNLVKQGVQALFDDGNKGWYYLAALDGKNVGQTAITIEWSDWRNGYWWWIQSVYITKEARKNGVFRALYSHIQQEAEKADAVGLRLYVDETNRAAQSTYKNLGMDASHYLFYEKAFDKK